ncbi:rhomboid family intramembrane serine protease [Lentibacillus amyloliquefaciens]|uniref:Rhomboid family intramembrane serine protease n=1 Tax=Lentibacillus amyloliquefaciens TaxID=1472767 RepID=A0A0U4FF42_9BACI|nr:rhomboid family intramembrane serine protease [Lentibacillus amyloliquefaciens]ALX49149.1 rhomboid family intramembrane serine protease [Lentibacillus amyloliquefaciens]
MFIRNERSIKEFKQLYPIVFWVIIIQLALWLLTGFLQTPLGTMIENWGRGVNFYISQGEYWRLLTSIFLHADLMHVLFNSFALVLFGPALEQMLGKMKFIAAYLGAGLVGNIATLLLGPPIYAHVGASGAIYGLFGIYVFMVAFRKQLIDQSSAQIVTVILVIGLIMTFVNTGINAYAHIFGFIGGFALSPLVLNNVRPFSPWIRHRVVDDGSVKFDPNRWHKKQRNKKLFKNGLWIFLGILIILGLFSRLL